VGLLAPRAAMAGGPGVKVRIPLSAFLLTKILISHPRAYRLTVGPGHNQHEFEGIASRDLAICSKQLTLPEFDDCQSCRMTFSREL
jgi:hypothetical protein